MAKLACKSLLLTQLTTHAEAFLYFLTLYKVRSGSITTRCSGNEPALLPRTKTGLEGAAEIEPKSSPNLYRFDMELYYKHVYVSLAHR